MYTTTEENEMDYWTAGLSEEIEDLARPEPDFEDEDAVTQEEVVEAAELCGHCWECQEPIYPSFGDGRCPRCHALYEGAEAAADAEYDATVNR
jgi:hypothetical protein